ncbi:MAG: ATP synthase F1 subunit delta [Gemmatimonadota bacterium]|jgi:F-type H+-transporting ATPase subunit delta|nr:ATP synthase F1 subunit delta [Gemmatimonadota bacterium]
MGPTVIARNYADTLLELARRNGGEEAVDEYLRAIEAVVDLLAGEPLVRDFLDTPRVPIDAKKHALEVSFRGRVPDLFLRFLLVVVEKRRQAVIAEVAEQYRRLVDEARGRTRAVITLAREADETFRQEIVTRLEHRTGKTVIAEFSVDPSLVGGVIIRVDGELLDGSLQHRINGLRRRMIRAKLPVVGLSGVDSQS